MPDAPLTTDFTQEIRFAVVMYGGSSLAIYMNGVAQELLRLVRATAPNRDDWNKTHFDQVSGSERIYRDLGRMLSRGEAARLKLGANDAIRTRFVIDVLSGTSAGGINAVFLAKALANDLDLQPLRDVWLKTADFGVLLNDGQGKGDRQKPPKSLVNSPLMYSELLNALNAMDKPDVSLRRSPYTDQLDLFTTFTDIQGQTIALKLADIVATERQHLHNFHFVYSTADASGEARNDFTGDDNPFLAFAARCTSAHPAAFEPMTLAEIQKAGCNPETETWQKFYEAYLQPVRVGRNAASSEEVSTARLAHEFLQRPFSDGGVLDNSPFTFAIDQLQFRNVKIPVDRKLIYIEPSPDHPELQRDTNEKPDAIANAVISLSSLPSYQFIQDDIRRILDRNLLVERVNRILNGVEDDYEGRKLESLTGVEFGSASIDRLIAVMGPAWGGYQRLRVAETTDDLVSIVTRAAGFSDDSDEFSAIRYLVRAWRQDNYAVRPTDKTKASENRFLYYFDLKRHVRRLKFILKKAAELTCFDDHAERVVSIASKAASALWRDRRNDPHFKREAREEVYEIVKGLSDVLKDFYIKQRELTAPVRTARTTEHPLTRALAGLQIDRAMLTDLLSQPSENARLNAATQFVRSRAEDFQHLSAAIIKEFQIIRVGSRKIKGEGEFEGKGTLELPANSAAPLTGPVVARIALRYYYDNYDHYDMVSYPILYSTEVGEELDTIEVFRISPEDASLPIPNVEERRTKLAGLSLGHFGALLDERYRVNDILWGRLDCADRLISALLRSAPPPADQAGVLALEQKRVQLITEAHRAIITEEALRLDEVLKKQLGLSFPEPSPQQNVQRTQVIHELEQIALPPAVSEYLSSRLQEEDPLGRFVRNFKRLHEDNPQKLLEIAGRASHILGQMLDDIADRHHLKSPHLTWITRLMRVFWGFVEVALPDTFWNILTRHLLKLLYLFEALMILGGLLLSNDAVQRFGITALGITIAVHVFILLLRDFTLRREGVKRALIVFLGALLTLAALLGIAVLGGILGVDWLWSMVEYLHSLGS